MARRKRSEKRRQALKEGLRSGLELEVAQFLDENNIPYDYEVETFELWIPESKSSRLYCGDCGSRELIRQRWYTPDFFLSDNCILEVKGRMTPKDRQIILAMRECHPQIDFRVVIGFDNKLSKRSTTRYSGWLEQNQIPFALAKELTVEWLESPTPSA